MLSKRLCSQSVVLSKRLCSQSVCALKAFVLSKRFYSQSVVLSKRCAPQSVSALRAFVLSKRCALRAFVLSKRCALKALCSQSVLTLSKPYKLLSRLAFRTFFSLNTFCVHYDMIVRAGLNLGFAKRGGRVSKLRENWLIWPQNRLNLHDLVHC